MNQTARKLKWDHGFLFVGGALNGQWLPIKNRSRFIHFELPPKKGMTVGVAGDFVHSYKKTRISVPSFSTSVQIFLHEGTPPEVLLELLVEGLEKTIGAKPRRFKEEKNHLIEDKG